MRAIITIDRLNNGLCRVELTAEMVLYAVAEVSEPDLPPALEFMRVLLSKRFSEARGKS